MTYPTAPAEWMTTTGLSADVMELPRSKTWAKVADQIVALGARWHPTFRGGGWLVPVDAYEAVVEVFDRADSTPRVDASWDDDPEGYRTRNRRSGR